jgi:hypothetical protein
VLRFAATTRNFLSSGSGKLRVTFRFST